MAKFEIMKMTHEIPTDIVQLDGCCIYFLFCGNRWGKNLKMKQICANIIYIKISQRKTYFFAEKYIASESFLCVLDCLYFDGRDWRVKRTSLFLLQYFMDFMCPQKFWVKSFDSKRNKQKEFSMKLLKKDKNFKKYK